MPLTMVGNAQSPIAAAAAPVSRAARVGPRPPCVDVCVFAPAICLWNADGLFKNKRGTQYFTFLIWTWETREGALGTRQKNCRFARSRPRVVWGSGIWIGAAAGGAALSPIPDIFGEWSNQWGGSRSPGSKGTSRLAADGLHPPPPSHRDQLQSTPQRTRLTRNPSRHCCCCCCSSPVLCASCCCLPEDGNINLSLPAWFPHWHLPIPSSPGPVDRTGRTDATRRCCSRQGTRQLNARLFPG